MAKLSSDDKRLLNSFIACHKSIPVAVDVAKSVFQVCYFDPKLKELKNFQLSRDKFVDFVSDPKGIYGSPMYFAIEACGGCNFWAGVMKSGGHKCRILLPSGVKAYLGMQKTDKFDVVGIFKALLADTKRAAPKEPKTAAAAGLLTYRQLISKELHQTSCAVRGFLYERGKAVPDGTASVRSSLSRYAAEAKEAELEEAEFAEVLQQASELLFNAFDEALKLINKELRHFAAENELCRRLMTIPGIGTMCAVGLYPALSRVGDFATSRRFSSYAGTAPVMSGTGGKAKIIDISKGPEYIRKPLHMAAVGCFGRQKRNPDSAVARALAKGKPPAVVISAISNRLARAAWAVAKSGGEFDAAKCTWIG